MKKQVILWLCVLSVASCGSVAKQNHGYSTLADMFVWGEAATQTSQATTVSYQKIDPAQAKEFEDVEHKSYLYNDDVTVKYVEVEQPVNNAVEVDANTNIVIKEVAVEEDPKAPKTYTLTKRQDRYRAINETFSADVYAILASRVANKFLVDIPGILAENSSPTIYIKDTEYADRYMPDSIDVIGNTTKDILIASRMITEASDEENAAYILKGRLTNLNTPEVPVFQYTLGLYDQENNLIDRWVDTIRQVQNDDGSWW